MRFYCTTPYREQRLQIEFDKYATEEGLKYTTEYSTRFDDSIIQSNSSTPFTRIKNNFNVTPENLDSICSKLSVVLTQILEDGYFTNDMHTECGLEFQYLKNGKKMRSIYTKLFFYASPFDITEEGIRKFIEE